MNVSEKGMLSLEEFHSIYESSRLKWKVMYPYPFEAGISVSILK